MGTSDKYEALNCSVCINRMSNTDKPHPGSTHSQTPKPLKLPFSHYAPPHVNISACDSWKIWNISREISNYQGKYRLLNRVSQPLIRKACLYDLRVRSLFQAWAVIGWTPKLCFSHIFSQNWLLKTYLLKILINNDGISVKSTITSLPLAIHRPMIMRRDLYEVYVTTSSEFSVQPT